MSAAKRQKAMAAIRAKDTAPELRVRRALFAAGYRYRLHVRALPGKPDIVLARHKTVIFVHGCFWHQHAQCRLARIPKSRPDYWPRKLGGNALRDRKHKGELESLGWTVLTIWECQTRDAAEIQLLIDRLRSGRRSRADVSQRALLGHLDP